MSRDEWNQSGVIPYRFRKDRLQVLVITSSSGSKYIFPKGYVEDRMTPEKSAMREAYEEAGVKGKIQGPSLGFYRYRKNGEHFRVDMFPLQVTRMLGEKSWPEAGVRDREWLTPDEAWEVLYYQPLADMVMKMARFARG